MLVAAVVAMLVGVALALGSRPEYRCQAALGVTGDPTPAQRDRLKRELSTFVLEATLDPTTGLAHPRALYIDSPSPDLLRLTVLERNRTIGLKRVRQMAGEYIDLIRKLADAERVTPTEAEHALTDYMSVFQSRLDETRDQVDAAIAALPKTDASADLNGLLARWTELRSQFDTVKAQLSVASTNLDRLEVAPEPTHGVVSPERRKEAQAADPALQQDLRELGVNLTELKLHLLTVWQQSAGALERLQLAGQDFLANVSNTETEASRREDDTRDTAVEQACRTYVENVDAFAEAWTREFAALRQLQPDPLSGEVLDLYHRVQQRLSDFLFQAGKHLSRLRTAVDELSADPRDTARHHVFLSNLVRSFQTLQAGHHRFEFAVEAIETPQNFRLDAALRSARGLRRRSQERIRRIERRLQAKALEEAKVQRADELAGATKLLKEVRTATDQTVDDLVALQEELNLNAKDAETFLRAVMKAEVASARLEIARTDLENTQERLRELAARRTAEAERVSVDLVSCEVVGTDLDLPRRLGLGGLGAGLTFLAIMFVQWWMLRGIRNQRVSPLSPDIIRDKRRVVP